MDARVLLFLLVLGTSWCCTARVVTTNFSPVQNGITSALQRINQEQQEKEVEAVEEFGEIEQVCKLCRKVADSVLPYLKNTTNQEHISSFLDKFCDYTLFLKDKCHNAVDYYLPLLYSEVEFWTPKLFCVEVTLCDPIFSTSQHLSKDSCESCHDRVTKVLLKLKDPDTQLHTLGGLLKACDAVEGSEVFAKKCKTLVSIYAPLVLANAALFLERYDICTFLDACSSATNATVQTTMHSAS